MSTEQNNGQTLDLRFDHYRSLTSALAEAMEYCLVWQTKDGGARFNIEDLYEFALARDKEHPLGEHEFYMVSCEGAIGKSPGFEYLTQWLLIPTEEKAKFCTNCGNPLVLGAKFCTRCGTKIVGNIGTTGETGIGRRETEDQMKEEATKIFFTGHYPRRLQALFIAMQRCMVWRDAATNASITYFDLFDLAKQGDDQHPTIDGTFYIVSHEGAIGFCPTGKEYNVEWRYIPMEPGEERDQLLKEVVEKLNNEPDEVNE
jgi:hypothetical protein